MVDVSDKKVTRRTAVASSEITMKPEALRMLIGGGMKKGEGIVTAKIAGINAAKLAHLLVPLCHPIALEWVGIDISTAGKNRLQVVATVRTVARTGAEIEAITAASIACITIYDMCKSMDKGMTIGPIGLVSKSGGKSGGFERVGTMK